MCHDYGDVAPRLIPEEILRKNPQSVIARRDLRSVEKLFAGRAAARDVGHDVAEDGLPSITRLAAFGVYQFDQVVIGWQTVEDQVVARLLEAGFGRAVGAQQLIAQAVNA